MIAAVGSLAGGPSYYHVLTPDFAPGTSATLQDAYADAFYATLQDGELRIGFSTGAEALLAAQGYEVDISHSETSLVHGLYSDYTALCCGVIDEQQSVIFLLTDTGAVEFVDVTLGLKSGYFCSSGLIMGVEDITGFVKGTTVQSVAASGAKTDLAPLVEAYKQSIYMSIPGDWNIDVAELTEAGGSDTVTYMITLSSDNQATMQTFSKQTGEAYTYEGYFLPFGMSEGGYVFYYCFNNAFGSTAFEGAAALYSVYSEGDNGYNNCLYWREMGTTGAFSALYEGEAILTESVG